MQSRVEQAYRFCSRRLIDCLSLADDVYMEVKKKAKDAMLAAIEQERDGDQIDRSLLKNVLGIFIEVGSHICHTLQSVVNVLYNSLLLAVLILPCSRSHDRLRAWN